MKPMRCLGLLVLVLAFFALGCKPPPSKVKFNDRMVRDIKRLASVGREFAKTANESLKNNQTGGLRASLTTVENTLKAIHEYHDDGTLPNGTTSGKDYQDAFKAFLTAQDKVVGKMRDAVNALDKGSGAQAKAILGELNGLDYAAYNKLKEAQKAFVDEHNFRPVDKYNTD